MARSLNSKTKGSNSEGMIDGETGAAFVKRLISLEDERDALGEDIKEVYREAREAGFPSKHLRQYVKDRRKDPDELRTWREYQALLEAALGPLMGTPLGEAVVERGPQGERKERLELVSDEESAAL